MYIEITMYKKTQTKEQTPVTICLLSSGSHRKKSELLSVFNNLLPIKIHTDSSSINPIQVCILRNPLMEILKH